MSIGILDYGIGNIGSIRNMLRDISQEKIEFVDDRKKLNEVDKLILPGVGKFDTGMSLLEQKGYVEAIREFALEKKKPLLGICLGMQLLGKRSDEGTKLGLGLMDFEVIRFQTNSLKIPHMGWNYITINNMASPIVKNMTDQKNRFYFVHSYYAKCKNEENILMSADYGVEFTAAVNQKNIYGVQFHPEKSHKYGKQLLKSFIEEC